VLSLLYRNHASSTARQQSVQHLKQEPAPTYTSGGKGPLTKPKNSWEDTAKPKEIDKGKRKLTSGQSSESYNGGSNGINERKEGSAKRQKVEENAARPTDGSGGRGPPAEQQGAVEGNEATIKIRGVKDGMSSCTGNTDFKDEFTNRAEPFWLPVWSEVPPDVMNDFKDFENKFKFF